MAIAPVASVLVVFGMLAGVLWWFKRLGIAVPRAGRRQGRQATRLESLGKLTLGPQHNLHLVRVDQHVILVACSPGGCALIRPGTASGDHRDLSEGDGHLAGIEGAIR